MPLKILLADDSLTAQNMAKKILTEAGYEVIAVSNGAQAMKKIASDHPDLVLLDVYMPGYTGLELCQRMRDGRETARIPVMLSVGKMEAFKPEEVTRVRADGLIIKPFEATELVTMVKKLAEKLPARPKHRPEPESEPEMMVELDSADPIADAPEFDRPRQAVEIPQAVAFTPVIGMELIPEELAEPPALSATPIEFEVEREPASAPTDEGPHMASAAGLSGVFEIEPTAHPAEETPAEPVVAEGLETFSRWSDASAASHAVPEAVADASAQTVEHVFEMDTAPESNCEPSVDPQAAPATAEEWSVPADSVPSEYAAERLDPSAPEAAVEGGVETPAAPAPPVLPELDSWEQSVTFPADAPHLAADPLPESASTEFTASGPVWSAEEAEIEPYEFAVPLHQQMQRDTQAGEASAFDPPASSAEGVAFSAPSWDAPVQLPEPTEQVSEFPTFPEATILPEFGLPPQPLQNAGESERAELDATEPASEPTPAPEMGHDVAPVPEFQPQGAVPTMTEVPVDPARVARIVEEVLQRLKPEVIAAVTRELEDRR